MCRGSVGREKCFYFGFIITSDFILINVRGTENFKQAFLQDVFQLKEINKITSVEL